MPKVSRRQLVSTAAFALGGFVLGFATDNFLLSNVLPQPEPTVTTPDDALTTLIAGNQRYMGVHRFTQTNQPNAKHRWLKASTRGQPC
jgi:hypothetical protein